MSEITLIKRFFIIVNIIALLSPLVKYASENVDPKVVKIVASTDTYICLDSWGQVYVWGNKPEPPYKLPRIIDIAAGDKHIVALDENGRLHGWGNTEYGEIDFQKNLPEFIAVTAGGYQTTALTKDGKVYKWGNVNAGSQQYVPDHMGKVYQIANGTYITAAIAEDGNIYMWGITSGDPPMCNNPVMIAPLQHDIVVLDRDGKIYGNVPHDNLHRKFKEQPKLNKIVKIFGSGLSMAAIDENGKLSVWGEYNIPERGQPIINVPKNLPKIKSVAISYNSIACVGEDGKVYQWGETYYEIPDEINGFLYTAPIFDYIAYEPSGYDIDVNTTEEFLNAIQAGYDNITIKKDMSITGENLNINARTSIIIDEGVRVKVSIPNLMVFGSIINNSSISVTRRIVFYNENSTLGNIVPTAEGEIVYVCDNAILDDIRRYLDEKSVYTSLFISPSNECELVIDKDYTLPPNKKLWLNINCTLVVNKGVTLTVNGTIETINKPIINGKVVGKIKTSQP